MSPNRPAATRTTRSQPPSAPGHTAPRPTLSSALPHWPSAPAVTVKRHGCTAPPNPSGSAVALSASRSSTPLSSCRCRHFVMRWARRTLHPCGPRAPRCRPTKRSPTPGVAAANANGPAAAGPHSPPPSATSSDWSAKGSPTTTSPPGFSSHRAPCKPTSPTSTPNSASPRGYNSRRKPPGTADGTGTYAEVPW